MGTYKVVFRKTAEHDLKNVDTQFRSQIADAIDRFAEEPFPRNFKHFKKISGFFILRKGRYRIIYSFDASTKTVTIDHIHPRTEDRDTY